MEFYHKLGECPKVYDELEFNIVPVTHHGGISSFCAVEVFVHFKNEKRQLVHSAFTVYDLPGCLIPVMYFKKLEATIKTLPAPSKHYTVNIHNPAGWATICEVARTPTKHTMVDAVRRLEKTLKPFEFYYVPNSKLSKKWQKWFYTEHRFATAHFGINPKDLEEYSQFQFDAEMARRQELGFV